jgi:hypothetical protein
VDPELARRLARLAKRLLMVVGIVLLLVGAGGLAAVRLYAGQGQPIPFSHRIHAGMKGISCLFCHSSADQSAHPGLPPVDKCLLCHNVIIPQFTPIQQIQQAKQQNRGIQWNRVNVVPDFVFFNHQIHVARGFDCSACHGNVKGMDRVAPSPRFTMGFCVNCHQANKASRDCYFCHR